MGNTLTESQKTALNALRMGPGPMAIVHFGKLRDMGLVEKAEGTAGRRGFAFAQLTSAGSELAG